MTQLISFFLCILLLYNCQQQCEAMPFLTAQKAWEIANKMYSFINTQVVKYGGKGYLSMTSGESQIYNKINALSTNFRDFQEELYQKMSHNLIDIYTEKTNELFDIVQDVQDKYEEFLQNFNDANFIEPVELYKFADTCSSWSMGELRSKMKKMHRKFRDFDQKSRGILSILASDATAADTMCIRGQSSQQLIRDLFEVVVLTDAKGLAVLHFGYSVKERFENQSYNFTKQRESNNYNQRVKDTFYAVKLAMHNASRDIWKCDPPYHEKHVTYTNLQVYQTYVMYESDFYRNPGFWNGFVPMSFKGCTSYDDVRLFCNSQTCKQQPVERRCTGHLRSCAHVDDYAQVCHSPPGSDRRYDWMKTFIDGSKLTQLNQLYGREEGACVQKQGVGSIGSVNLCFCNCESEDRSADRYFSLSDKAVSDIENNKVVTGVRFRKENHVIHIQIQQGTLEPNGTIKVTPDDKPEWKIVSVIPTQELVENFSTFHHDKLYYDYDKSQYIYDDWTEFHKNKEVYAVKYHQSVVYLDSMESRSEELLTGLKFVQEGDDLKLVIHTTPFDYTTGKLNTDLADWRPGLNSKSRNQRSEVKLVEPDDPTKRVAKLDNQGRSAELDTISDSNKYVEFQRTDLKSDLGQYTVPFIDLQNVETQPPMLVSGAGLIHRGRKQSGGFLAFKLIHYDYLPHM